METDGAGQKLVLQPGRSRIDKFRSRLRATAGMWRSTTPRAGAPGVSATATGLGLEAVERGSVAAAAEHSAASRPAAAAAARSESTRSPTTSVRPSPRRSSAVRNSCGSGLPTISAVRSVAVLHGRQHGARAGPEAVGLRVGGVARRGEQVRAPQYRLDGVAQVVVDEGRRCRPRPRPRRARRGRCRSAPAGRRRPRGATSRRADHEGGAPGRVSASTCCMRRRRSPRRASEACTPILQSCVT